MAARSQLLAPALHRLREPDVRALCGGAAFGRGDAWQRLGHVAHPTVYADGLGADVRGTWRQVERVTVKADGKGLLTTCSCGAGEFCRHAAALLLHWLRAPQAFVVRMPEMYGDVPTIDEVLSLTDEPSAVQPEKSEFTRFLERHTMADLREIARRRGVRASGRNKSELAATLAVALAEPANIDAALATLSGDEQALLWAIDLIDNGVNDLDVLDTAYQALADGAEPRELQPALHALLTLGLVFSTDDWSPPSDRYTIPREVAVRMILTDSPLSRAIGRAERVHTAVSPHTPTGLDLIELLLVVVHEALHARVGQVLPAPPVDPANATRSGWAADLPGVPAPKGHYAHTQSADLILRPQPPVLSDPDRQFLAERSGVSVDMIDFATELLAELDILTLSRQGRSAHLSVRPPLIYALLRLPRAEYTALLTETWLSLFAAADFRSVVTGDTPLRLHTRQMSRYVPLEVAEPRSSAVRILMTRLVGRLAAGYPAGGWYDLPAWLDLLWTLTPDLLGAGALHRSEWWFSSAAETENRLALEGREDWQQVWEPLVTAMLLGPMSWLRLVDTGQANDGTICFRPRPEAALLLLDGVDEAHTSDGPSVVLRVDPHSGAPDIVVPAGYPDVALHALLAETTDLATISPAGLGYRLSRERAQVAFDLGGTVPDLCRTLEAQTGDRIPDEVRAVLDAWWAGYGKIRLYDDLTLLELDDDILLQELLVTSSLRNALLHLLTPRLVAVAPAALPSLLTEMERLGYTPRVLEDE